MKKKNTKSRRKVGTPTKASGKATPVSKVKKAPVVPVGDRVLVKPFKPDEMGTTTSFGIIIPDTVDKEKSEQGKVVAVGPGKTNDDGRLVPVSVKVGDKVMFNKYGYEEVKVGGVEYYIVSESNILAVLN